MTEGFTHTKKAQQGPNGYKNDLMDTPEDKRAIVQNWFERVKRRGEYT